jgi:hypothetical protein
MQARKAPIMYAEDYDDLLGFLMDEYCLPRENMVFVGDIASWCRRKGIPESDAARPMKFIASASDGCKMLVRKQISDNAIAQRIHALSIRNQLKNNLSDIADRLNSNKKKLAYLFLFEYGSSLPEVGTDEYVLDQWAFKEMERLGFFRE